ncbi:MAG TPA: hypothetical protein VHD83_21225 [Puia sp.]|nr:hypothetical protein [Puia sp.]
MPNGPYSSYYEDGHIKSTGILVKGQKTSVWKFFDSSFNLLKVQHFSGDSVIYDLDPEDFRFEKKTDEKFGFTIKLPAGWTTELRDTTVILASRKSCDTTFKFCPNVVITKDNLNKTSFKDYIDSLKMMVAGRFTNLHVVTERMFSVDGKPAFQAAFYFTP